MIVTWLTGGLGNQMFQYAAGLALAERRRTVQKLDVSWYREYAEYEAHNRYALSCFNITEQFASAEEIDAVRGVSLTRSERWLMKLSAALRLRACFRRYNPAGNWHRPPTTDFYPQFFDLPDNTYLHGMFQSEKFFGPAADLLRLHFSFRYPASPEVGALAARIAAGPSAAVHFRRGDYLRNPTFKQQLGVLDLEYYRQAVRLLRQRSPSATLYIFSDDIEAVAAEFRPDGPHEFVRCVKPWHAYDKIRLMSQCEHIAVANSTFSWWAAWLNPSPSKLVVAPDPWFAGRESSDLAPDSWVRLKTQR